MKKLALVGLLFVLAMAGCSPVPTGVNSLRPIRTVPAAGTLNPEWPGCDEPCEATLPVYPTRTYGPDGE
jgi:hypothetical protein